MSRSRTAARPRPLIEKDFMRVNIAARLNCRAAVLRPYVQLYGARFP